MAQLKSTNITGYLSATGNILAPKFIKLGGTSAQFLKADGSVDTNTYLTTTGTAADSSKLGGVAAASYATQDWVSKNYTNNTGTVTSITAGTGLTTASGSAITSTGTISLDVAGTKTALGLKSAAYTDSTAYATSAQGTKADTAHGWGNHADAGYLPLTAGYYKPLTGILYANKPIGIKGTFDNNVVPTEVQGVAYLAYNSSSKSLDFIFN